jgi:hypothetical protein
MRNFLPLNNPNNRCAANSAFQALLATNTIGETLNNLNNNRDRELLDFRDYLINDVASKSDYNAFSAIANFLKYYQCFNNYRLFNSKNDLIPNIINNENIKLFGIRNCNGESDFMIGADEQVFVLKSAIYFHNSNCNDVNNDSFGHYIALVKRDYEDVLICNDSLIIPPKEENNNDCLRFPKEVINCGTTYKPICYFYEKLY